MPVESKPVLDLPTDFSELYEQEESRRMQEEQENNKWTLLDTSNESNEHKKPRQLSEEEIELWQSLVDSDDEDKVETEEENKMDEKEIIKDCKAHITKRLQILREGKEENLSTAEFESLPLLDRTRLKYTQEFLWDSKILDVVVKEFILSRMENCPREETVIGYQTVMEMYDPILGPELYYLSLYESSCHLQEQERWSLFGY